MHPVKVWTLDEANAALPEVRSLLADVRAAWADLQEVRTHIEDLRIVWGERVQDPECPDHAEWQTHLRRFQVHKKRFDDGVTAFEQRGIALKDVESGLVDFWALRGDELVFLCWRDGEDRVATWHSLDGGFSGRQPVPDLGV